MDRIFRKLHLGCFDQIYYGWVNTDVTPHIFISRISGLALVLYKFGLMSGQRYKQHKQGVFHSIRYLNVTKRFPYADATFDFVFSTHLLEHLYTQQAISCINETFRVLKRGGVVRIVVPDLDRIVENYDSQNPDKFLEAIFEEKQRHFRNKHHWLYNKTSLTSLLKESGFSKIYRCKFQVGNCADLTLIDNRPESLFMEAIK